MFLDGWLESPGEAREEVEQGAGKNGLESGREDWATGSHVRVIRLWVIV